MGDPILLTSKRDGVTTLTMNDPRRLNGWTQQMMTALREALSTANADPETKVVVLTATDPYYSAGVNLAGAFKLDAPAKLHAFIVQSNRALFEMFLDFGKPILVAVNGPAIGATVTSATLCDAVVASERATFSTPFARLGVTPEGCSSEVFPRKFGAATAERMLGREGWVPTASEAKAIGLVELVVPHDRLLAEAERLARSWIEDGKRRAFPTGFTRDELRVINARESEVLADAFLASPFLMGQFRFLWSKRKRPMALLFLALSATRPLWSLALPRPRATPGT
jgi:enoyl-CoA hydratase/carnithine racemase